MDRLAQLEAFVLVADHGSFTRAARSLGVGQSTVSKGISALEARLGATLFARGAQGIQLTQEGLLLLEKARGALDGVAEAERALRTEDPLTGPLRISAPAAFGRLQLAARLARWAARHPRLRVELTLSDHVRDLAPEGLDLAIRLGEQPDSSLRARRIGASRRVLVAHVDYASSRGLPAQPSELQHHELIVFRPRFTAVPWILGGQSQAALRGRFESDNAEACLEAVQAGLGLSLLPSWLCERGLRERSLVEALPEAKPSFLPIYALVPGGRTTPERVEATIRHLKGEMRLDPALSDYGWMG